MGEKMMSFEEWWKEQIADRPEHSMPSEIVKIWSGIAWEDSRKGTIPAEGAIALPPVEEWPEWAEAIDVCYLGPMDSSGCEVKSFRRIPRPKPAWTPKVGEAVFCGGTMDNRDPVPGIVDYIDGKFFGIKFSVHNKGEWDMNHLKPFDATKIGLPWEEIQCH